MKKSIRITSGNELARSVERSLDEYFRKLDGEPPHCVYEMVIAHVERALLTSILDRSNGNQTHAAELLGLPTQPYQQKVYVTCLDLGEAGALFTRGWERTVEMVGEQAKKTKQEINTVWIYPPRPDRAAALASADPERVTDL